MKNSEIKLLSDAELDEKVLVEKDNYQKLIFTHHISQIENTSSIRQCRRLIARLLTEQTLRDIKIVSQPVKLESVI